MSAASFLARRHGDDVTVTVFERGGVVSYAACGLPYFVSGEIRDSHTLLVRAPGFFVSQGIELLRGHEVTDIDPDVGLLTAGCIETGEVVRREVDKFLIATGAVARVPQLDGLNAGRGYAPPFAPVGDPVQVVANRHLARNQVGSD
ncbi:MAG: hypothetical protein FJW80_09515 [Actinobacteria bacterium]|nr:hypothetical protein [Actinomycetota bacterium]